MPLWLRRTTFNMLKEYYDKQKEENEKDQNIFTNKGKQEITRPNIDPTYTTTKALKK